MITAVMILSVRLALMMPQSASYRLAMAIVRNSSAGSANFALKAFSRSSMNSSARPRRPATHPKMTTA